MRWFRYIVGRGKMKVIGKSEKGKSRAPKSLLLWEKGDRISGG